MEQVLQIPRIRLGNGPPEHIHGHLLGGVHFPRGSLSHATDPPEHIHGHLLGGVHFPRGSISHATVLNQLVLDMKLIPSNQEP